MAVFVWDRHCDVALTCKDTFSYQRTSLIQEFGEFTEIAWLDIHLKGISVGERFWIKDICGDKRRFAVLPNTYIDSIREKYGRIS